MLILSNWKGSVFCTIGALFVIIEYLYPAVFEKENDGYAVTVPDIFGGVTCGDSYEDALKMAEDMVKMMLIEAPGQCFEPKSLEETKKNFPNKIVVMIRVEIDKDCIK